MDGLEPNDLIKDLLEQLGASGAIARPLGADPFQGDPGEFAESKTPELVTFVGYLGAAHPDGDWRQFYLDLNLRRCLWIDETGIVAHRKLRDRELRAADREKPADRDMIWVKADAQIVLADASRTAEVQFLTGEFTRAGDFDVEAMAGALSPATGKFCGRSPACCAGRTPR